MGFFWDSNWDGIGISFKKATYDFRPLIRKEACTSDPERLSVSDNKLQVGELTGELRVARHYHHLNRLKSVLSESSVVDELIMKSALKSDIESPKSAENVFNPKTAADNQTGGLKAAV